MKFRRLFVATTWLVLATYALAAKELPRPGSLPSNAFREAYGVLPADIIVNWDDDEAHTAAEYFKLALAEYATMDFDHAMGSAFSAVALCKTAKEKAVCLDLIAQCYGAKGQYDLAAESALKGLRRFPQSKELAALRVVYNEKSNDKLNMMIAQKHLMQLDPGYQKNPKMELITAAVIIVGIICTTAIANQAIAASTPDPEVGKAIAQSVTGLYNFGQSVFSTAVTGSSR